MIIDMYNKKARKILITIFVIILLILITFTTWAGWIIAQGANNPRLIWVITISLNLVYCCYFIQSIRKDK